MKINDFSVKKFVESLQPGEYYLWTVHLDDGTSEQVQASDYTTEKAVRDLFAKEGKEVTKIDYNFGIQGGQNGGMDQSSRQDYHRQQNTLDKNNKGQGQRFTGYTQTRESGAAGINRWGNGTNVSYEKVLDDDIFEDVKSKWQELNELSVNTMSAYRDATANPRSTDRLGKVVKHARGHNQAINKIAKATGDKTPNKDYARVVHEGNPGEYPHDFAGWQQDASARGLTVANAPQDNTGNNTQNFIASDGQGNKVGHFSGQNGSGILGKDANDYQQRVSGQGFIGHTNDEYNKEVQQMGEADYRRSQSNHPQQAPVGKVGQSFTPGHKSGLEEGSWVTKSQDGVEKRFKDRDEAEAWKQNRAKPAKPPRELKAPKLKLTYDQVWQKIEQVVANIFPDGDPIDYLAPWLEKQGYSGHTIGQILDRTCKEHGYLDIYDYYEMLKLQYNQDNPDSQLNEISNEVLSKYKKAAGADASAADKSGDFKKGDKRFNGIVKATNKQFDNDKKKSVQEALLDILGEDFTSILNKQHANDQAAKPRAKTVDVPYHGWIIRYRPAAGPNDKVVWQVQDKKGEVKFRSEATTDKDAVQDAEAWINKGGDVKQAATSNVTIDFNVDFAKEFSPDGDTFYATIDKDGNTPMLIVSTEPQKGFKTSHVRTQAHKMSSGTTKLPTITLSAKEANAVGLQANGRYILGPKDPIDDHVTMFPLIFQSIVQGKGDMMKMGKPGLTVAHNRD